MNDVVYLAWRYLAYHRLKTAVLVTSITIIIYLPVGLNILVSQTARQLTARAQSTPLLVGAKGSPLELVLSSLYFESDVPPATRMAEADRVTESGLAQAIPLYTRFRTRHSPIVGTSLEYFEFRRLRIAEGRPFAMLGECVLGAMAARAAGVTTNGSVISRPENVFDIAGVYPLKMHVVGVLQPSGTPDDRAVFVDLKTTWVIEGLAHGHEDLRRPDAAPGVLRKEGSTIVANASVVQFNEITAQNVSSFHFHGDPDQFPTTSVIAVPHDQKSGTLLQGRYVSDDQPVQITRPAVVMSELLDTILAVRRYIMTAVIMLALSTLSTIALVFVLSLQLRRGEINTMVKIGGARQRIASVIAVEVISVLAFGAAIASVLAVSTTWLATYATRILVQMS